MRGINHHNMPESQQQLAWRLWQQAAHACLRMHDSLSLNEGRPLSLSFVTADAWRARAAPASYHLGHKNPCLL